MNRGIYSLLFLFFAILTVYAQDDETILTIGGAKISKAEFERIYKKNNNNLLNESEKKTPEEYLGLFINFKLKVLEAQSLKMDTAAAFINELAGYRKELAAPYLTDIQFEDKMVHDLYDRMKKEVSASHILFMLDKNAPESQVQTVLSKITGLREQIVAGKDFNEAAREYSEDPSAKTNGGSLGYFSAFQMVAPFEDAAFSTPEGQVSAPVRSSFGYHLIKVNDIRENRGEIKVAHIMKMFPQGGATAAAKKQLKSEIDSVYSQLKNGADFAEMAKKYSDDKRSAVQGGEMPWFSAARMIPEFSEPAFALKNIGDYSTPIETSFGYHIIKKLDSRAVAPFEQVKGEIENRIKKDPERSFTSKKLFIQKLKKEYHFKENTENLEWLKGKNIGQYPDNRNFELFVIDHKSYGLEAFNTFLEKENRKTGFYTEHVENWIEAEITRLEDSKLENKYPEFRYLLQEYHDGILLFNISEQKIWDYAAKDSTGLELYFRKNKGKYLWEERFKGYVVVCTSAEAKEEAEKYFAAGMNSDEILSVMNTDTNKISITEGAWEKGSHPIVDYFVWNAPEPQNFVGENTFIRGDKIPPEPKTLDEARGLYISDYQNYIEKEWLKELKGKYKTKVNKKLLKSIPGA